MAVFYLFLPQEDTLLTLNTLHAGAPDEYFTVKFSVMPHSNASL